MPSTLALLGNPSSKYGEEKREGELDAGSVRENKGKRERGSEGEREKRREGEKEKDEEGGGGEAFINAHC